jgi:putative transposase
MAWAMACGVIPPQKDSEQKQNVRMTMGCCLKKSKFTDSQIMEARKRVEAELAVPELCREMGISSPTFYKWRAKYGGMDTSMMARMRELEQENARLKKRYAEERLKAEILREALGIEVDFSLPSARIIRVLERIIERRGRPDTIRCDNGPENIRGVTQAWAELQMRNGSAQPIDERTRTQGSPGMSRTLIIPLVAMALLLAGCGPQDTGATQQSATKATSKVVTYPVESQLDKFEFRPNECAGEFGTIMRTPFGKKRLYYLPGADPTMGGAALDQSTDSDRLSEASWYQALDLNDDGLCDLVSTSFAGNQANGHEFAISMRIGPGYEYEKDFHPWIYGGAYGATEYFDSEDALDWRHGGPMPLPGTRNDQFIVFKIYPKAGGMPYIVMPSYEFTKMREENYNSLRVDLDGEIGSYTFDSGGWPGLYVYRWEPTMKKFRQVYDHGKDTHEEFEANPQAYFFGKATAEYWAVRAYLAERYLQDGLKEFKAHDYLRASFALEYATAADPRNPDLWAWLGNLEYASGHFKDAARYFETAIAWTHARNLPVPPTLYFNLGMAYESACWNEMQDRREGDKPGCEERMSRRARAAYEAYLKAAPQGERTAEVRQRLADMARGVFREPVVDQAMAGSAGALDRMAAAYAQAQREMFQAAKAKEEAAEAAKAKQKPTAALDPETGQPRGAPTADVFKLTPADLKKIDDEINRLLRQKGKTFPQSRIDWMVAYKAKFPQADLNDMIDRPEYYEALPWVKKWRATYRELSR